VGASVTGLRRGYRKRGLREGETGRGVTTIRIQVRMPGGEHRGGRKNGGKKQKKERKGFAGEGENLRKW